MALNQPLCDFVLPTWSGRSSSRLTFPPLPHRILQPTSSDVCLTSDRQLCKPMGRNLTFSPPVPIQTFTFWWEQVSQDEAWRFSFPPSQTGLPHSCQKLKIISELVPVRGFDRCFCLWWKVVTSGNFLVLFFFFFLSFDRVVLVLVMMRPDLSKCQTVWFDNTGATWGLIANLHAGNKDLSAAV